MGGVSALFSRPPARSAALLDEPGGPDAKREAIETRTDGARVFRRWQARSQTNGLAERPAEKPKPVGRTERQASRYPKGHRRSARRQARFCSGSYRKRSKEKIGRARLRFVEQRFSARPAAWNVGPQVEEVVIGADGRARDGEAFVAQLGDHRIP